MAKGPRVFLIHAVAVAMGPIAEAFARDWPEAGIVNLLEDSLSPDRARDADLTQAMEGRIVDLCRYARRTGADAVLYTCSAFGPAIEAAAREAPIPVLKPNEAMFEAALARGERIGMLATFGPSVGTMEAEFAEEAARRRPDAKIATILVDRALDALKSGDAATHNALVAARAPELAACDAVVLAHFSTSRAAEAVRNAVDRPVLTSPDAAVAKLKRLLA
jgi:Asp/Glu/hydantoin racemase